MKKNDALIVQLDDNNVAQWVGNETVIRMLRDAPGDAPATYGARLAEYDANERRLDYVHQQELNQWTANENEFAPWRNRLSNARQRQLNDTSGLVNNAWNTYRNMDNSYNATTNTYNSSKSTNVNVSRNAVATTNALQAEVAPSGTTGNVCRNLQAVKARVDDNNQSVRTMLGDTFLQKQRLGLPAINVPGPCNVNV